MSMDLSEHLDELDCCGDQFGWIPMPDLWVEIAGKSWPVLRILYHETWSAHVIGADVVLWPHWPGPFDRKAICKSRLEGWERSQRVPRVAICTRYTP